MFVGCTIDTCFVIEEVYWYIVMRIANILMIIDPRLCK